MQSPNIRMHLTGYSGLRPLPPAGDAGRYAARDDVVRRELSAKSRQQYRLTVSPGADVCQELD
jgi:hypothetical protein